MTVEEFLNAYNELCNEYGYMLTAKPDYVKRDDGTFSTVIRWEVIVKPASEQIQE